MGKYEIKTIKEIANTQSGGTPSRKVKDYYIGDIPWVKSGELQENIITETEEKITQTAIDKSSAKLLPINTLLVAMYGANVGRVAILGIEAATNQAICAIQPKDNRLSTEYLYYYFIYYKNQLLDKAFGGAQKNISQQVIKNLEIPVPTIEDQKQIVSKIKECFTLLDKSEEKLKQAKEKLNSVMDSVYHQEIPTLENLNESTITKLEVLTEKITDGSHNPPMKQKNGKLMLSAINIENDFLNIEANVRYIKEEDFNKELNRSGVKKGDVLLTAVGTIGRTLVVKEFTDFVLQRSVTLIRPKDTEISQYLSYYLRTPYMQRYFLENAKGTAQKGIYLSTIRKLEVVIPERSKMRAIIEKIDNVRNATTTSLKHIESLQNNLQIERQSILKKAFEGTLI